MTAPFVAAPGVAEQLAGGDYAAAVVVSAWQRDWARVRRRGSAGPPGDLPRMRSGLQHFWEVEGSLWW